MLNKEKLLKVLQLTQSDSDGEALNAIRIANQLLKNAGLAWNDVILAAQKTRDDPVTQSSDIGWRPQHRSWDYSPFEGTVPDPHLEAEEYTDEDWVAILTHLAGRATVSELDTITSIADFFFVNGYLTRRQMRVVLRMYRSTYSE